LLWPLLAALAAAVICGLPHLVMIAEHGPQYTPFSVVGASGVIFDETIAYAPRVQEVLEGRYLSGDPHGFEHKGNWTRALPLLLPTTVLAGLARLLGGSVVALFIIADFLFPALGALCAYYVARNFGASQGAALCSALLVVLGADLVFLPKLLVFSPVAAVRGPILALEHPVPLEFSRTFVPQFSYLLVLLAVLVLQRALLLRSTGWTISAGAVAGLLFYTYAYAWTYVLCALLICALWLLAQRDKEAAGRVLIMAAVALAVGAPMVLVLILDLRAGPSPEMMRFGAGWTPLPWMRLAGRLGASVLFLLIYPRKRPEFPLVAAMLLAPLLCALVSDLSGLRLQDWHWVLRYWGPWLLLMLPILIEALVSRRGSLPRWAWAALAVLVVAYGANKQYRWAEHAAPSHLLAGDRPEGLRWLNQNARADAVVMGLDFDVLGFIPVYTRCNIYMPFSILTPAPTEELLQRFAHTCATLGLDQETMLASIIAPQRQSGPMTDEEWICYHWTLHFARRGYRLTHQDLRVLNEAWDYARRQRSPRDLSLRADYLWLDLASGGEGPAVPGWRQAWRGRSAALYEVTDG